jgi:hypothetical protein
LIQLAAFWLKTEAQQDAMVKAAIFSDKSINKYHQRNPHA